MRIATFNINNVNKRLANLLAWLAETMPDVVCLQELKAEDRAFPHAAIEAAGYGSVWRGQRTWNGVAILARGATPVVTRRSLPGDPADDQARYIEAAVNGVLVASIYLPNGNPHPGPKFAYKLAWFDRLIAHAGDLMAEGVPVVLAGDYNVVPTEADIWPGHHEQANALLQPESRAAFQRLLDQGWTDSLRTLHPEGPLWTFWGYLRHRWPNDKGMRLDHLLLSPDLAPRLRSVGVDREARGQDGASDHAPTWIELEPPSRRPPRRGSHARRQAVGRAVKVTERSASRHPTTPDGRYFVVRGRLWRMADPALSSEARQALVNELMTARRAVRSARAVGDEAAETQAHAAVDHAKRGLGERGPVWWTDGAPDLNRHMARTTPYAAWCAELAIAEPAGGSAAGSCAAPGPDGHRRSGAVLSEDQQR